MKIFFTLALLFVTALLWGQDKAVKEEKKTGAKAGGGLSALVESCVPSTTNGASLGDEIYSIGVDDAIVIIGSSDDYLNQTDNAEYLFRVTKGTQSSIQLTNTTINDQHGHVFIDVNRNGQFEANELVGSEIMNADETVLFPFTADTQFEGSYVMRFIMVYSTELTTGCDNYTYGQIVDARININSDPLGYCMPEFTYGMLDGDYLQSFSTDQYNMNLGDYTQSDYYYFNNIEYVRSDEMEVFSLTSGDYDNDIYQLWIDMDQNGAFEEDEKVASVQSTSSFQPINLEFVLGDNLVGEYLRARIACQFSDLPTCDGSSSYGNVVDLNIVVVASESDGYCTPIIENGILVGDIINGFQASTINYSYTGSDSYYEDLTDASNGFINLTPNQTLESTLEGNGFGGTANLWIDKNQDATFATDEKLGDFFFSDDSPVDWDLNVGDFDASGVTRMRLYSSYNNLLLSGCDNAIYGHAIDFTAILNQESEGYCSPTFEIGNTDGDYIAAVGLGDVQLTSIGETYTTYYNDFTAESTDVTLGETYNLFVQGGEYDSDLYTVFADFNADGDFEDAGETIGSQAASTEFEALFFDFQVPSSATEGATRVRIICADASEITPCMEWDYGEYLEFTVNITSEAQPVSAEFNASATEILSGESVDFFDLSSNGPISWSWTFDGGTPATSTDQNPTGIVFTEIGCHDVTLEVSNADGSDVIVKNCFVEVVLPESISEEGGASIANAFPNPSNGVFTLDYHGFSPTNTALQIYDQTGKLVHQQALNGNGSEVINPQLSAGMYIANLSDGKNIETLRLTITE